MAEPLGVAFIEIEPIAPGFRAKTEAQLRGALAGSTASARAATSAQEGLTVAENQGAVSADRKAAAEVAAARATHAHASAAVHAREAFLAEGTSLVGLRGHSLGLNPAFIAATAGAIALVKSLEISGEFEESLHQIEAATHASRDEMEKAREAAIGLGDDLEIPLTSAHDAAEAINFLARSGLSLDDSLTAARGALLLTAASGETLEASVRGIDRILDAFNLTASETERVADAVAIGLKFTQGNATEFASALATLAPAADALGLSLEATNTLVLQLSESGLPAAAAAGTLRQAFLKLVAGGKGVEDGLKRVGLSVDDLFTEMGKLRPDAFVILSNALDGLNRKQQLSILTQIFSRRAALGVIRIVGQQAEGYELMAEKAREAGVAQEEAQAKARAFGGQVTELQEDVKDLSTQFGRITQGPATLFIKGLRDIARQAETTLEAVNKLAFGVVGLGQAFIDAVPHAEDLIGVLEKFAQVQRDPLGGIEGFLSGIPDRIKDTATGLQEAINLNVKGIADIPGIQELADNLGLISGAWEKARTESKKHIDGLNKDAQDGMNDLDNTTAAGAAKVAGNLGQLDLAVTEAQNAGNQAAELAALRQRRAGHQQLFNRLDATARRSPTKEHIAAAARAQALVDADDRAIEAILSERESAAKTAADKAKTHADNIAKAADERDQNFIRAIQTGQETREGAATAAAATAALGDDIHADVRLRNFLTKSIAATEARIRQARAAGRSTLALAAELAVLRKAKNAVRREILALQAEQKQTAADTRVESAELDLQIIEARIGSADPTRGQNQKLLAAHQRVIAALKKAQSLTKTRSIEWKRLQVQIEQEKAAIRGLQKSVSGGDASSLQALQKAEFAFLQTTHGFASNLFGNLIPGTATSGLVGGQATASGRPTAANLAVPGGAGTRPTAGLTNRPVSAGQGNTQIQLLREIRNILLHGSRSQDHPEVHVARKKGAAAGDYSYGYNGHGM